MGGNAAMNAKYEAYVPDNYKKLRPDSLIEERADFIRRKYEMQQYLNHEMQHFSKPVNPSMFRFYGLTVAGFRPPGFLGCICLPRHLPFLRNCCKCYFGCEVKAFKSCRGTHQEE